MTQQGDCSVCGQARVFHLVFASPATDGICQPCIIVLRERFWGPAGGPRPRKAPRRTEEVLVSGSGSSSVEALHRQLVSGARLSVALGHRTVQASPRLVTSVVTDLRARGLLVPVPGADDEVLTIPGVAALITPDVRQVLMQWRSATSTCVIRSPQQAWVLPASNRAKLTDISHMLATKMVRATLAEQITIPNGRVLQLTDRGRRVRDVLTLGELQEEGSRAAQPA